MIIAEVVKNSIIIFIFELDNLFMIFNTERHVSTWIYFIRCINNITVMQYFKSTNCMILEIFANCECNRISACSLDVGERNLTN